MISRAVTLVSLVVLTGFAPSARSAIVEYDVTNVSGSTWQYDYFVTNDSLSISLDEFTIFFARQSYENLALGGAAPDWDPLAIQPDPNLPDDGFYDALALGPGIAPSATLGGFFLTFTWLGAGTPGSQLFDVIDPTTFLTIESGVTRLRVTEPPPTSVSEPQTIALLGMGALLLLGSDVLRRRKLAPNA